MRVFILLIVAAMLGGCGTPGAPQPPSLQLPLPPADLVAERQGDHVVLTWTAPQRTTDKQPIRHAGKTRICRVLRPQVLVASGEPIPVSAQPVACDEVARVTPPTTPTGSRGRETATFTDTLPRDEPMKAAVGSAVYAVEALNDIGRGAGMSNQAAVPLAPTLGVLPDVRAQVTTEGVQIFAHSTTLLSRFPDSQNAYHLYRRSEEDKEEADLGGPIAYEAMGAFGCEFVDNKVEWEKVYTYRVAGVTTVVRDGKEIARVRGESSAPIKVLVHDVFPPGAPQGVQAVFTELNGQRFIDLTWTPNQEPDLAGYNLYRREAGGAAQKINADLLRSPATRDSQVAAGKQYFYSVSAVDLRGNESARSPETSERVPQ